MFKCLKAEHQMIPIANSKIGDMVRWLRLTTAYLLVCMSII